MTPTRSAKTPTQKGVEQQALVRRRFDPGRRSVLITGASGFLGRNLVDRLLADRRYARIVCTGLEAPARCAEDTGGLLFARVDLTSIDAAPHLAQLISEYEVDSVVHLAFTSRPTQDIIWAHELEVIGTMRLLDACAAAHPRKLICWSQSIAYGAHPDNPFRLNEEQPLRGMPDAPFVADKVEAERLVAAFARDCPSTVVTLLRTAPLLSQQCGSYLAHYLQLPCVPTVAGYDPLIQVLGEQDAMDALKVALDADFGGAYNIAAGGVLPLQTAISLAGKLSVPVPFPFARSLLSVARTSQLSAWPVTLVDLFRYACIIDTSRSEREMGFRAQHDIRQVVSALGRPETSTEERPDGWKITQS